MQFKVLGPLEAVGAAGPVELGPRKQRLALSALLLAGGEVVATDRLIDLLWPDESPRSAPATLRTYLSNLRITLRDDGVDLVRRAPGYALAEADIDVTAFDESVASARALFAAERWEDADRDITAALRLWRGPFLADLADDDWVRTEAAAVELRHQQAREIRARTALATGHVAEALAAATALVGDDQWSEAGRRVRLVALHRSGRQVEALAEYRSYASGLDEHLGVEPSRDLRELQIAMLRDDPELGHWPRSSAQRTIDVPESRAEVRVQPRPSVVERAPLVGRQPETSSIQRLLEELGRGASRWMVLSGSAGIGKTRLAEEAARLAAERGWPVLWTAAADDDGLPAWQPMRAVARALGQDPDEILQPPRGIGADEARYAVYEALTAEVRRAAAAGPVLLVVDDVQWLDEASVGALAYLARNTREQAVGVVLTLRTDVQEREGIGLLLSSLSRGGATVHLEVQELPEVDAVALLQQTAGAAVHPSEARELVGTAGGNPLLITEYARLPREDRDRGEIPLTVRAVMDRRLQRLAEPVRELLEVAAVVGDVFPIRTLVTVTGRSLLEAAGLLAEAEQHRIVEPAPGGGGHRFTHILLRDRVLDRLPPLRRSALHAQVAETLSGRRRAPDIAMRAQHLVAALPLVDADDVVTACWTAAEDALQRWDWPSAVKFLTDARAVARTLEPDDDRDDALLTAQVDALARTASGRTLLEIVGEGLDEAARAGRTDTLGWLCGALLRVSGAWPWAAHASNDGSVVLRLERITEAVSGDPVTLARVLAARATGEAYHPDLRVPDELSARALAIAEQTGDPGALADAVIGRILVLHGVAGRDGEVLELLDRLGSIPQEVRLLDEVLRHNVATQVLFVLGRADEAVPHLRAGIAAADSLRLPGSRAQLRWSEVMLTQWGGDLDATWDAAKHALELQEQTELEGSRPLVALSLLSTLWQSGRLHDAGTLVDDAYDPSIWRIAQQAQAGDVESARRGLAKRVRPDEHLIWYSLAQLTVLAHIAADVSAVAEARTLRALLTPHADLVAKFETGSSGPVALAVARLELLLGDRVAAAESLGTARRLAAGSPRWTHLADQVGRQIGVTTNRSARQ